VAGTTCAAACAPAMLVGALVVGSVALIASLDE
jgi:hypothetical protein